MEITTKTRQELKLLGTEKLVDILVDLAERNDDVNNVIERTLSTPQENVKRFKKKLASIKHRRRFVDWRESRAFANELEMLLEDLEEGINTPEIGLKLVADFYKSDEAIFNMCDDSSGNIGDVFRCSASDLFRNFASKYQNKNHVCEIILDLLKFDDYGIRDSVMDHIIDFLPEDDIRKLIKQFWDYTNQTSERFQKQHWLSLIEELAKQIKDAPLFEKARRLNWAKLNENAYIDIAKVYLESNAPKTALTWLEQISSNSHREYEVDQLLFNIHKKLGNSQESSEIAWRMFHKNRNKESLEKLLRIIGKEKRESVIQNEVQAILQSSKLDYTDANFLIEVEKINEAERYIFTHINELNGDWYTSLLPLAEAMEKNSKFLVTSLIYRSLLDSILQRAISKYYHHGVRYLKKIEKLSKNILDWKNFDSHKKYFDGLLANHGRKKSFWGKYEH